MRRGAFVEEAWLNYTFVPANDFVAVAFGTSFEALIVRALTPMPEGAVERLKAVGFDPTKPIQAAYPALVWLKTLRVATELLFPGLSAIEAHRRLGVLYMEGFEKTFVGKATFVLGRAIGTRRMMPRMTRNFRSSNNFLDTTIVEQADGSWSMTVTTHPAALEVLEGQAAISAAFTQGIMQAMLGAMHHRNIEVKVLSVDEACAEMKLSVRFTD